MSRAPNRFCTPPSSPPSSPSATWDSSPPSSPATTYLDLSVSESSLSPSRIIDPLAASYNANRSKLTFSTPQPKRTRYTCSQTPLPAIQPFAIKQRPQDDLEYKIWEEASNTVFESGCRTIDLSDRQLTRIPAQFIYDLNKMVVLRGIENSSIGNSSVLSAKSDAIAGRRPFTRVQTAPTSTFSHFRGPNPREKSISTNSLLSGNSKDTIQLFLARNKLSKFPLILSRLENLTFLSLRHNYISYLPPEVARLKNLQSLNICNNRLTFVPSELLGMKLQSLLLFPNPFISPPPSPRPISKIEYFAPKVPPLTELALRVLLARPTSQTSVPFSSATNMPETLLEQRFDLPLPIGASWCPLSPLLQQTLSVCVPGSVLPDESLAISSSDDESMQITGIGTCPNPEHGQGKSVFVMHAEQRFTWERKIAGLDVGGAVPVRWRGCQRGCLDFLCPDEEVNDVEFQVVRFGGLDFED
ncbi:hypothetical protein BYT27DRAFT_7074476 [Phlegmacium glaucopus]|nr:hypothetical protein BYT27DRAFT_7074476 [Phlegmacium glaucopus]